MAAIRAPPLAVVAPLVLPVTADGATYEGFIAPSAAGPGPASLWLRISGVAPGAPTLQGARLEVNGELAALLEGRQVVVVQRLAESPSLTAFIVELQNMVDQLSLERVPTRSSLPASFFGSLKRELSALGWQHVAGLSEDLSRATLAATDAAGRRHELRLALPPAYPSAAPVAAADLPTAFELRWGPGAGLADALAQFEAALAQQQQLWDGLDDLDTHAWVIEPTAAPRSVTYRRIAVGHHVSLALTLDPLRPGALPLDCRFMGADAVVAPLRQRLHSNRALWRSDRLLRLNLEAVLELELPRRQGGGAEDASADCAICYAYRLSIADGQDQAEGNGEAPDTNCDNAACGKPFHRRCLVEWLNADTSTRQSFSTLFGACPYCSTPITVRAAPS